ncbi:fluoride efflux transporter FluC [Halopiger aswanensis]|uniref:Fluoride-specific ion channel FluC n=1 Tax=Halopiger aswanensis TaxID=148449 RepID=A0A3R7DXQ4_9EURY|nr:CrcB family protein [Halopiger aswanensis]RKD93390.1 CrcB protein [Halopiger aswanensis]
MVADRTQSHPLVRLETLALIAVGGFAGSNLRYFVDGVLPAIPAVIVVNAAGSFLLGLFAYEAQSLDLLERRTRLVFTTGFLSSLTTYSTFAIQTALEAGPAEPLLLAAIVVANYGLGFAGVLASRALVRHFTEDTEAAVDSEEGETA